ncbi:MAG: adenosylcobinamide-GDP ribazoletransferase [Lachnospiraceae bacterium]|nr:adenosylcobinamide-GDP ribazoletransferase [Lachnospiraceae bacterium]
MKKSKKNKKYELCFFPLIGIVIGAVLYAFDMFCREYGFDRSFFALVGAVLPVLMSGGIFLAGFMNTADALFQAREKKKQSEGGIKEGTFGALTMAVYFLLYAGALILFRKNSQIFLLAISYIISRTLCVMAFLWFPAGKQEESSVLVFSKSQRGMLRAIFSIILALCFCTCFIISSIMGTLEILIAMWIWTYYYYMSKKSFGGVTKASIGYFLILCELAIALFVGIFGLILP